MVLLRNLVLLRFLLLIIVNITSQVAAIPNSVEEARLSCLDEGFLISVTTTTPVHIGRMFVKGHSSDNQCTQNMLPGLRQQIFKIYLSNCGTKRIALRDGEAGSWFAVVVVVSFHNLLITATDRAFRLVCIYDGQNWPKLVTSGLTVSPLPALKMERIAGVPDCYYELRQDNESGLALKNVEIGMKIAHVWFCNDLSKNQFIWVHDCEVVSENNVRVAIIDSFGCLLDPVLIDSMVYVSNSLAVATHRVFRFADTNSLYFRCQVSVCRRDASSCLITNIPPSCTDVQSHNATTIDVAAAISDATTHTATHKFSVAVSTTESDLRSQASDKLTLISGATESLTGATPQNIFIETTTAKQAMTVAEPKHKDIVSQNSGNLADIGSIDHDPFKVQVFGPPTVYRGMDPAFFVGNAEKASRAARVSYRQRRETSDSVEGHFSLDLATEQISISDPLSELLNDGHSLGNHASYMFDQEAQSNDLKEHRQFLEQNPISKMMELNWNNNSEALKTEQNKTDEKRNNNANCVSIFRLALLVTVSSFVSILVTCVLVFYITKRCIFKYM